MKEKPSNLCFAALRLIDERLLDQEEARQLLSEKKKATRAANAASRVESIRHKQDVVASRAGAGPKAPRVSTSNHVHSTTPVAGSTAYHVTPDDGAISKASKTFSIRQAD